MNPRTILLAVAMVALAAGGAGAKPLEINPYPAGNLSEGWTLEGPGDAWSMQDDILYGGAKSKEAAAIYSGQAFGQVQLFFQVAKGQKNLRLLLGPEGEGERVLLTIDKRWVDRKLDYTRMKMELTKGSAVLIRDDEELKSWKVPEGKYEVGFSLKRGGKCELKRVRFVWERPPEPVSAAPAGFANVLEPGFWNSNVGVVRNQNAVDGTWEIGGGMLTIQNKPKGGVRKYAARVFQRQVEEYELRFKVASGVLDVMLLAHMSQGGNKQYALNGFCTDAVDWHEFVVKLKDAKVTLSVNGREFPAEPVAPGTTRFALLCQPGGRAQIKDFFIRTPGMPGGAIGIGGGEGQAPRGGASAGGSGSSGLFNGKDLSQWSANPPSGAWEVVDGNIFAFRPPRNAFLINKMHRVANYTLTFKVENGTRGLGVVTKFNTDTRNASTIAIQRNTLTKPWYDVEVIVQESTVRLRVNGQEVASGSVPAGQHLFGFFLAGGGACRIRHPALK